MILYMRERAIGGYPNYHIVVLEDMLPIEDFKEIHLLG